MTLNVRLAFEVVVVRLCVSFQLKKMLSCAVVSGLLMVATQAKTAEEVNCSAPWADNGRQELESPRDFYDQFELETAIANTLEPVVVKQSCLVPFTRTKNIKNLVVVDVRDEESYGKYHIPGAINIPRYALSSKTFLKQRPVLLVDHGYRYHMLVSLCDTLPEKGFLAVYVLDGGIEAWNDLPSGGNARGVSKSGDVRLVSVEEFASMPQKNRWIVFDFSSVKRGERNIYHLNLKTPVVQLREKANSAVRAFSEAHGYSPMELVINENGDGYADIATVLPEQNTQRRFYLKGGTSAYQGYTQKQRKILQPKTVSDKKYPLECE